MFVFKRTSLPVARSIHYQLIDIQLEEVQQMVHDNDGQVRAAPPNSSKSLIFHSRIERKISLARKCQKLATLTSFEVFADFYQL